MVRQFDPTRTDPTVMIIRGAQDFLYRKTAGLSSSEVKSSVERFLSGNQYSPLHSDFKIAQKPFPDIVIKNNCRFENFFLSRSRYSFNYFKGAFEPETNKIYLCSNFLLNLLEVKENLDRELVIAHDYNVKGVDFGNDREVACSLVKGCKAQLENYGWNEDLTKEMSRLCARNLFKKRGPNEGKLPFDSWVRYANLMVDESMKCFYHPSPLNP